MTRGVLIFAHNSKEIDYALLSLISGGLAKKFLKIPVSLVTDRSTIDWMKSSGIYDKSREIFDKIIEIDRPREYNYRSLSDGDTSTNVPFINSSRFLAYQITPYEKTLLLDSDFLIFSDRLNHYWDISDDVCIAESSEDINSASRVGYHDRYVSDVGIKLLWATTVMFTKNEKAKRFFDLVDYVKTNYNQYADVFRFEARQYRNDISFSIARHITDGFVTDKKNNLPPILTVFSKDILHDVKEEQLILLISNSYSGGDYILSSIKHHDIHIINKQSIIRNSKKLLELI